MEISVRDMHNGMIKPYGNGGLEGVVYSVTQKVLISDTPLMSFIPPKFCKMTLILHQICGCEIFVIPKDIKIDLNRLRTKFVSDLQHNYIGRHTQNSTFSTKSAAHYKEKFFPDGECLHDTTKDTNQCISCNPIKPNNNINMKFDLGFLMIFLKKIFLIKNYMAHQILH